MGGHGPIRNWRPLIEERIANYKVPTSRDTTVSTGIGVSLVSRLTVGPLPGGTSGLGVVPQHKLVRIAARRAYAAP